MPAVSNLQYLFDALLPQRVASQVACLARLFLLSIMFFIVLIPPFFFQLLIPSSPSPSRLSVSPAPAALPPLLLPRLSLFHSSVSETRS